MRWLQVMIVESDVHGRRRAFAEAAFMSSTRSLPDLVNYCLRLRPCPHPATPGTIGMASVLLLKALSPRNGKGAGMWMLDALHPSCV